MYWVKRSFELYESLAEPRKVVAMQLSLMSLGWIKANQRASVAEEGIAELRNVLKTGLQYNLPDVIVFSYAWLAFTLVLWGRGGEAERVLAESMHFEQMSGLPHPSFAEGWKYFFSGEDWGQGIEALQADIKRREQANIPALVAIEALALVQMLIARNELDEAELYLQRIQPVLQLQDQYIYLSQMWWALAKLSRGRGDPSRAQALYERILHRWKTTEDTLIIPPILLDGTMFYADGGNLDKARQWLNELQGVMQLTDNPIGAAALLQARGALNAAEGKIEEAIPVLREAVHAWGTIHWCYHQALASQRLAGVLLVSAGKNSSNRATRQAAREEADMLLEKALAVYERLQIPAGIQAIHALRTRTLVWRRNRNAVAH
jgi:tetratricopeptide (TPR) repeat protein